MSAPAAPDSIDVPAVIEYLHQQQRKGETHVHLDNQAKLILREFYARAKGIKTDAPQQAPSPTSIPTPVVAAPATAPTTTAKELTASGSTTATKINSLLSQAQNSAEIKSLRTLRDTLVFSAGNPDADIMLIGDHPGYHEEKNQTPFSGPAGKKLDGILKAMGLDRDQVYLSYIVKYRPLMENQTTGNRPPSAEEIAACDPFIREEIKAVSPKVIITLGSLAANHLLDNDQTIELLRGQSHQVSGIPTVTTHHPSYLIYNEGNADKRMVWEDMLTVMQLLNMPISDKQQGYFR